MNKINLILLAIISFIAICIDCFTGYILLLMFAMPIGHYLSPLLLFFLVLLIPVLFIASVIGLFILKRWAYWIFFIMTLIFSGFLIFIDIFDFLHKIIKFFNFQQIFLMAFFIIFIIYFLLPSTRRIFKK